jgi:hypothetical protein
LLPQLTRGPADVPPVEGARLQELNDGLEREGSIRIETTSTETGGWPVLRTGWRKPTNAALQIWPVPGRLADVAAQDLIRKTSGHSAAAATGQQRKVLDLSAGSGNFDVNRYVTCEMSHERIA